MERVTAPAHLLRVGAPEEHYVLRVVGENLLPECKDGDYLVILRREVGEVGDTVLRMKGEDVAEMVMLAEPGPCRGIVVGLMRKY